MILFYRRLAAIKERRLAEMIEEARASLAYLLGIDSLGITGKAAHVDAGLKGTPATQAIWIVGRLSSIDRLAHEAVTLIVVHRRNRPVDRDLVKVWTT